MPFIYPMLASAMPKKGPIDFSSGYVAEQKFDGHRLIVEITENNQVFAWGRNAIPRLLSPHVAKALSMFPIGIYDGELLVPDGHSYGVTELTNASQLVYTIFDILQLLGKDTMSCTYDQRRAFLEEIFSREQFKNWPVVLAKATPVTDFSHVMSLLKEVWEREGEGLILKKRSAIYTPDARPKGVFIKMKALRTAVLTITGFRPSTGGIVDRGPHAITLLRDDDGNEARVKTLNDDECRQLDLAAPADESIPHPAIGRRLQIEFQERTPLDKHGQIGYRHPRWDHWE